jgi:Rrf2 family protein
MQLSRASEYALAALCQLARAGPGDRVTAHKLARTGGVTALLSRQVLRRLVAAGILTSQVGRRGCYRLARTPSRITVREAIEAVEGPHQAKAGDGDKAAASLPRRLAKVTLAELTRGRR